MRGVDRLGGGVGTGALRRGAGTGTMGACGGANDVSTLEACLFKLLPNALLT